LKPFQQQGAPTGAQGNGNRLPHTLGK